MRWLLAFAGLLAPCPVLAAPNVKYFPDDAEFAIVVNVKQILGSKLFQAEVRKRVRDLCDRGPVGEMSKGLGLDPLKDLHSLTVLMGPSCWKSGGGGESIGPVLLLEGRFPEGELRKKIRSMIDRKMGRPDKHAGQEFLNLYFSIPSLGLSTPEKNLLAVTSQRDRMTAILDRAAGKKTPRLESKAFRALLEKVEQSNSFTVLATGDMIARIGGAGEKDLVTLREETGLESILVVGQADTELKVQATLVAKDAATASKIEQAIKSAVQELSAEAAKKKSAVLPALKSLKITVRGSTLTLEGTANAAALAAYLPDPGAEKEDRKER